MSIDPATFQTILSKAKTAKQAGGTGIPDAQFQQILAKAKTAKTNVQQKPAKSMLSKFLSPRDPNISPFSDAPKDAVIGIGKDIASSFKTRAGNIEDAAKDENKVFNDSKTSLGVKALTGLKDAGHVAGNIAGVVTDAFGSVVDHVIPDAVKKTSGDAIDWVAGQINKIAGVTNKLNWINKFMDANPDVPKSVSDVVNTVSLLGVEKAEAPEAKEPSPIKNPQTKTMNDFVSGKSQPAVDKATLEIIKPQLSKIETEKALAQGRGKGGGLFSKTEILPDKRTIEVAKAMEGIVKKGETGAENISRVKNALTTEADTLQKKVSTIKQPVSVKGVTTWLDGVEKPIEIKSDDTLNRKFDITKNSLRKILTKNIGDGGNVSTLLKSRKEFDSLVDREFPTLYDRENAPFRSAVKSMRDALNNAIEANLPDGFGYKESLKKQSLMYDAIDNIAGKSANETKQNGFTRFIKKHPLISTATGAESIHKIITGHF